MRRAVEWLDLTGFTITLCLAWLFRPHTPAWLTGTVLAGVFLIPWMMAKSQLGSAFSLVPEARHLVTRGLYSKIRHPIYIFGTLALLSALLSLVQSWVVVGVACVLACVLEVFRARREQRVLRAAFGEEYDRYRNQTWF